jgi:hypothetical protein
MARTVPTFAVSVAWTAALTGVFRLDHSLLDGTDELTGAFGGNVFDDITNDVKDVQITRGRQGELAAIEQGRCVLRLKDPDGTYNPDNTSGPLNNNIDTHRPLKIEATHLGTTYGLFYGFTSKIEHRPARSEQETVIEAVDFFEFLNAERPTIASTGATTVGTAIGLILDAIEWTDASMRSLEAGRAIPDFDADGSKTALQHVQELLQVDLGLFFVDGSGVVTFISGDTRWKNTTPVDTFADSVISDAHPSVDKQGIINRQTVTATGGTAQTYALTGGKPYYDGSAITTPYLSTDPEAMSLAQMVVTLRRGGRPPVRSMTMWGADNTRITKQLTREIGDRVTFSENVGGTDVEGTIEGITHAITSAGYLHRTRYLLSKRTFDGFTLDVSLLDGVDVLVF